MNDIEELLGRLRSEFPELPRSPISLGQALVMDNWGGALPFPLDETWTSWADIPAELLNKTECLLTYFDAVDVRYFLPAFIKMCHEQARTVPPDFSNASLSFASHLGEWSLADYEELDLSTGQRLLVNEYVVWMLNFPDLAWEYRWRRGEEK